MACWPVSQFEKTSFRKHTWSRNCRGGRSSWFLVSRRFAAAWAVSHHFRCCGVLALRAVARRKNLTANKNYEPMWEKNRRKTWKIWGIVEYCWVLPIYYEGRRYIRRYLRGYYFKRRYEGTFSHRWRTAYLWAISLIVRFVRWTVKSYKILYIHNRVNRQLRKSVLFPAAGHVYICEWLWMYMDAYGNSILYT